MNILKVLSVVYVMTLLAACAGPRGESGAQGEAGSQGPAGANGANGLNGADGNQITVVALCPGHTNYGTFIETALCINGQLQAVYSLNGGFLTTIVDGNYSSNAVGSACNFTVTGCVVSH